MEKPLTIAEICDLILQVKAAQVRMYQTALAMLPAQKRLWQMLQTDCESHAIAYGKARAAAAQNPGRWLAQAFTVQVPNLLLKEMPQKMDEIRAGKINVRYAVTFMADCEKSFIDAKLYDAVRTDAMEFTTQLDGVKNESLAHVTKLRELLPQLP